MKGVLKVSKEKASWLKITNMAYIIEYENNGFEMQVRNNNKPFT